MCVPSARTLAPSAILLEKKLSYYFFQRINASHFCENFSFKLIVMANAKTADPVQHLHVLNDGPLLIITRGDFQGIRSKDSIGQEV